MALASTQAWLTYVTKNEHLTCALVLAKSLRKTGTRRRIGVIICGGSSVSSEGKNLLGEAFDDVFVLDRKSRDDGNEERMVEVVEAKIFAFSLQIFDKIIFLEPNSLLLENADRLFQKEGSGILPLIQENGKGHHDDDDFFLFTPCRQLYEYLCQQGGSIENEKKKMIGHKGFFLSAEVKIWMENQYEFCEGVDKILLDEDGHSVENCVMQLSLERGEILEKERWNEPLIIHLIHGPLPVQSNFVAKLESLKTAEKTGLAEKVIIQTWLNLFSETCSTNPAVSPSLPNIPFPKFPDKNVNEPIAIIGISCRLPSANTLEEFWNLLYSGQEGVRELPPFRWRKDQVITAVGEKERKTRAGFLSSTVDEFDSKFFGISPKEAAFMDPQTRLLHEVMWESLENAGVDTTSLYGSHTGIFTGSWMNDYRQIVEESTSRDFFRIYMGNSIGASAARLSFLLGLTGPSIATESGCSSAIVAVDMAVKSLRCGETNLALAGGVNLILHPFTSNILDYVIAPDGRCKTFDAKADGFGRAEGCGFLVLKRLSDALNDRDHIWALIRGSAVSQEGLSRSLGTPTVHCEALAMHLALKNGGVLPHQVTFLETHGTGTRVGDPMEVAAIAKAYNSKFRQSPLVIGSVKTNVGHTESCSGITGIIKTVLALKHELIPKHLNLEMHNPDINLDKIPAIIPLEAVVWPKIPGKTRLAGVSSFGITGTDGHVIIQEAPDCHPLKFTLGLERPLHILKISAKTSDAMEDLVGRYRESFDRAKSPEKFEDFAFTANTGRASFDHRAFILASDFKDASAAIQKNHLVSGEVMDEAAIKKICFLFPGQGSQYPGMAKCLYETSPVFRFYFDHCATILLESYGVDILKILWGDDDDDPSSKENLSRTIFSQTSIFCVEYCLLRLWESWGVKPDYVLGHSLGEFCAAVAAGILTFEAALKLVAVRSQLIDNLPHGKMLVLKAGQKQIEEGMKKANIFLDVAAVNDQDQTVIAGDTEKILEFFNICKRDNIKGVILEATHAFHSCHMDAILEEYKSTAQKIEYFRPTGDIKYVSGMEGKIVEHLDSQYWIRHTREKVNFLEACQTLAKLEILTFLEIGPHPVLSSFVLQNNEGQANQISCYPSLRRNKGDDVDKANQISDWDTMLTSLGKLWLNGYPVNWNGFDKPYCRQKIASLPLYPFKRKSFWVECKESGPVNIHPLLGGYQSNASKSSIFQNDLVVSSVPYLREHCVGQKIIFPGAGFTEMCLAAGYCVSNFLKENLEKIRGPVHLENLRIEAPLELKEGKFCRLQVIVDLPQDSQENQTSDQLSSPQGFRCKVFHRNAGDNEITHGNGKWVCHATATFFPSVAGNREKIVGGWNGTRIRDLVVSKEPIKMDALYKKIDAVGLKFGENFRSIQRQWIVPREEEEEEGEGERFTNLDEIVAEIKIPQDFNKYLLHPVIIDAMIQAQIFSSLRNQTTESLKVPVHVGKLILLDNLEEGDQGVLYIHANWTSKDKCTVFLSTSNFSPIAFMEDIELLETNVKTIQSVLEQQTSPIPECWEETWKNIQGPDDNQMKLSGIRDITESAEFVEKLKQCGKCTEEDKENKVKIDKLLALYCLQALYQLGWEPKFGKEIITPKDFCRRYKIKKVHAKLVRYYFTKFEAILDMLKEVGNETWEVIKTPYLSESEISREIDVLFEHLVQQENPSRIVAIFQNIAKSLAKVLQGEMSALALLFPVEPEKSKLSPENMYLHHPGREDLNCKGKHTWSSMWRTIRDQNGGPDGDKVFRVLEVGAGTGSFTFGAVDELYEIFGNKFEYYFTDISASFFARADKRLEKFRGNMKYVTFNLEESPISQGVPVNYFDLITASHVLHAPRDLKECLTNLRMTLKPQGSLTFIESLEQDFGSTFVYGLLEGYWRFQDFGRRPHHPCVDGEVWREVLMECGFSYVHTVHLYFKAFGIITAEASGQTGYDEGINLRGRMGGVSERRKRWVLLCPKEKKFMEGFLKIGKILEICGGIKVDVVVAWEGVENEEDEKTAKVLEILGKEKDLEGIIYAWGVISGEYVSQRELALPFMHIAKFVLGAKRPPKLYVVTRSTQTVGVTDEMNKSPWSATLFGMAKSLKNEGAADVIVRCVDLDDIWDEDVVTGQIFYELAMSKEVKEKERVQVAYRNGSRYEPRFNRVGIQPKSKSDLQLPPSAER